MKILIACEKSGVVRDAFIRRGFDAASCDLEPSESSLGPHFQCDVSGLLNRGWDLMIAHPPCTYLCSSGIHWNTRRPERAALTEEAIDFVRLLLDAPIPYIALENPIGIISSRIRKPDQIIQPYQYGDDASKATCLWLKGLPLLTPTDYVQPRFVNGRPRWSNQTDSGQNKLPPKAGRAEERSRTYFGIAAAMAQQWGDFIGRSILEHKRRKESSEA